jgi:5-methylcytosine-specific restriction endonuclease McrA
MRTYDLTRVRDADLIRDLDVLVVRVRADTAAIVAHIAEVDARRLYAPAGYPSMHAYCVGKLRLSEDAAYKRIRAARAARRFPAIFEALADGRLHLAAVCLLSLHLTPENAEGLLAAATHKTRDDIERMLAERFPRTELLSLVQGIPAAQLAPGRVESRESVREFPGQLAPGPVEVNAQRSRVRPLSPMSFALQITIGKSTHDKLRYAQELLSHRLPSGDIAQVFDRALDALVGQLEKRKFAATSRPRPRASRPSGRARHIPAHVKRAVWQRDRGQCTFVGEQGQRCRSRKFLEFDHIDPVARGGKATVDAIRLRCRSHNQYEAERTFGAGFMNDKREETRRAAAERSRAVAREHARDVMAALRELKVRPEEARRAVEYCATIPDASLEDRTRAALRYLCPKTRSVAARAPGVVPGP